MNIGLFGGTFDPIHLGHVDMIRQLCQQMALDKVIFIPAYIPPLKHKPHMTAYEDRLAMTRLAVAGELDFEVSTFESESDEPSYSLRTVRHFAEIYPQDRLFYIMGVDAFNGIEKWYRWQELLCAAHFIVIDRPHKKLSISQVVAEVLRHSTYDIYYLPLHTLPISSTMIRTRIQHHEPVDAFLAQSVLQYIQDNHLYQLVE